MSVSEESSSRRKHITSACVSCRESKVKCDGAFPTCSSCQSKGKQCLYQTGDDKRRLSHRMAIELLSNRVDELCQFIRQNSLEPPSMDNEKQTSLMKVLSHLRLSDAVAGKDGLTAARRRAASCSDPAPDPLPPSMITASQSVLDFHQDPVGRIDLRTSLSSNGGSQPPRGRTNSLPSREMNVLLEGGDMNESAHSSPEDHLEAPAQGLYPCWGFSNFDLPLINMQPADFANLDSLDPLLNHPDNSNNPHTPPELDNASSSPDDSETLVKQLSNRIGTLRIGPGGQVQYYGPTSNFNLVDMGAPDNLTVHRSVRDHGPEYLKRLDMGKAVPPDLEDHLLNLYFAWQDPAFHVVKRGMYQKAKTLWRDEKEDTPYFSEALQNAMCSLGAAFEARHHPTFTTFPKSLADFFADRAKILLEIELDSPCVSTVQALILLSSHDIGCKRDSRGWLYSGMATRLAFHLALHFDMTSYVSSKSLSPEEADLRRDVFWAAYTVDHIWSFHLGRAFRINMESVTIGLPDSDKSVDVGQWIPYVSPQSPNEGAPLPDYAVALHRQRVLLCEIMAPLAFALYGNLNISPTTLHELNVATVSKLLAWKVNLPPILHVNTDNYEIEYLPHVLLLHMLYHQNIIYAHRPWMSGLDTDSQLDYTLRHNPTHARSMCIDAAVSIAKLLEIYETRYGLRRINIQAVGITCSAALLLIFAVVIKHPSEADSMNALSPAAHLGTCFRALDEFGSAWESAKQARDFLTLLQRRWELQARKFRKAHDPQSPVFTGQGHVVPMKRPRTKDTQAPEPQSRNLWLGSQSGRDARDVNLDAERDWIFMRGSPTLGHGYEQESLDSLL